MNANSGQLNSKQNLVSVIIPAYSPGNASLGRTLDSVLIQTYNNFEIIIVDDGSVKPIRDYVNCKYAQEPRVRWVRLEENIGVAKARNQGIRSAKGAYLAFLDCGDWWEPEKLEKQVNGIESSGWEYGLIYCASIFHKAEKEVRWPARVRGKVDKALMVSQALSGSASSVMVRKEVIDAVGLFDEGQDLPEDRDYWLRVARQFSVESVSEFLVHIEVRPGSRSTNVVAKEKTYMAFLQKHSKIIKDQGLWGEAKAHYHFAIAFKAFGNEMLFMSLAHFLKGVWCSPLFWFKRLAARGRVS